VMDIAVRLGRNVRALRLLAELSQNELGFRSGMGRSYVSAIERGTRAPTVRAVGRLAAALGVHPSRLLDDA